MRKLLLASGLLLLLATTASAVTIESPDSRTYLDQAISVQVSNTSGSVTYTLNGGANSSCGCVGAPRALIAPDGKNVLRVYDDRDASEVRFTVDTLPPNITRRAPKGTVYEAKGLRIGYKDVSRIAVEQVEVQLDGKELNGSVNQTSFNSTLENITEGTHTVSYNIPDDHWRTGGNHNATGSWNFTLPEGPVLSGETPKGVVGEPPALNLTARDPAGIDINSSRIVLSGPVNRSLGWEELEEDSFSVEHGMELSYRFAELPDGFYTVDAHVEDSLGNTAELSWNFTVDTTPPNIAFLSHVEGDVITGRERFELNVSDLTDVSNVSLVSGGIDREVTREEGIYTVSINTARLEDGENVLTVEAEDSAGNTASANLAVTVDNHAPRIEELEVYPETAVGGIQILATVTDNATEITDAGYRIERSGEAVSEGSVDSADGSYSPREEEVQKIIDLSELELEDGWYSLLLSAEDGSGHISNRTGQFRVDNSLDAELVIEKRIFKQEIGTESVFDVKVSNTGEVDELVKLSARSDLNVSVVSGRKRIEAGETKQFQFRVSIPERNSSLGNHSLTLTAEGLSSSASLETELIVQPQPERRQQIQDRFQQLKERFSELQASRDDWSFGSEVDQSFERTSQILKKAGNLIDQGRYSAAERKLEEASKSLKQTRTTFTAHVTRARVEDLASAALKILAFLAVVSLIYAGYRLIPEEEGYHPEKGYVHRPEGKHPLHLRIEDWLRRNRPRREGQEEEGKAVERWEGYRD
ncbi:MAG: Ig-like domain-containing protein [Candidatus Nanohaloarchaea archaeon]|nr:Ig-like domain-containing protein [Candidatus Nanohaloarchaea archaeon]